MYMGNTNIPNDEQITVAYVRTDDKIYFGVAYCCSADKYNKAKGKSLAVSRLLLNGNEGINIVEGERVYDTIWRYLYYFDRGGRLTYNKPSWVNGVMVSDKIATERKFDTTRSLYVKKQMSTLDKILKFFGFYYHL